MLGLRICVTVTRSPPMLRAKSATWVVVATTASLVPAPVAGWAVLRSSPHAVSPAVRPHERGGDRECSQVHGGAPQRHGSIPDVPRPGGQTVSVFISNNETSHRNVRMRQVHGPAQCREHLGAEPLDVAHRQLRCTAGLDHEQEPPHAGGGEGAGEAAHAALRRADGGGAPAGARRRRPRSRVAAVPSMRTCSPAPRQPPRQAAAERSLGLLDGVGDVRQMRRHVPGPGLRAAGGSGRPCRRRCRACRAAPAARAARRDPQWTVRSRRPTPAVHAAALVPRQRHGTGTAVRRHARWRPRRARPAAGRGPRRSRRGRTGPARCRRPRGRPTGPPRATPRSNLPPETASSSAASSARATGCRSERFAAAVPTRSPPVRPSRNPAIVTADGHTP